MIKFGQTNNWINGTPGAATIIIGDIASGSNGTGANGTIEAGNGTGTGGSGALIFEAAPPGSSGSSADTMTEAMRITNTGSVGIGTTTSGYPLEVNGSTKVKRVGVNTNPVIGEFISANADAATDTLLHVVGAMTTGKFVETDNESGTEYFTVTGQKHISQPTMSASARPPRR
jgi:hypothetical protein